jgi:YD repeat-containing protein
MKQTLMLMLSLCLIFSACGKSEDEPSIEGKNCQISTVGYETHKYDAQGRLINISHANDLKGITLTYTPDLITILGSANIPDIKLKMLNGRVTEATTLFSSRSDYTFSYDSDGYLIKVVLLEGGEVHTYTYSYTSGNLTKIEGTKLSSGKLSNHPTITIDYSTELASNVADIGIPIEKPFIFTTYKVDKYFGKQSKNLVKAVTELGATRTFTYTKDVNGNITSIKRHDLSAYMIDYSCK